ncbi:MAG: alpha/beta fold hydrolase [Pseudomonadota bacterium]
MIDFPALDFDIKFRPYTLGGAQFWSDVHWQAGWRIQRNASNEHYRLIDAKNRRIEEGTYAACFDALQSEAPGDNPKHLILLVHGLLATWRFLQPMATTLQDAGLSCALINYATTRADLNTHGRRLAALVERLEGVERLDAVTHSMGGLVLCNAFAQSHWPDTPKLEKVVMLAPPLRGASIARLFAQVKLLHPIVGPPLTFLQAPKNAPDLPNDIDLMVIAGARGKHAGFNPLIEGDDDGTVAVRETRPRRPHHFHTVRAQHTWLRNSKQAKEMTRDFLLAP